MATKKRKFKQKTKQNESIWLLLLKSLLMIRFAIGIGRDASFVWKLMFNKQSDPPKEPPLELPRRFMYI